MELAAEGKKMGEVEVGTMIETPAAVLIADDLAKECDFFSIGTNDLTQYTCALDRQNAKLEPFANPHHPAVLREIKMTIDAGHRNGIWVGICGELGADESLVETFLRMGIDELSVNPKSILPPPPPWRRTSPPPGRERARRPDRTAPERPQRLSGAFLKTNDQQRPRRYTPYVSA